MSKKNDYIMTIRLTHEEEEIVKRLKQDYAVNISQYIRNKIIELDNRLKNKMGKKL